MAKCLPADEATLPATEDLDCPPLLLDLEQVFYRDRKKKRKPEEKEEEETEFQREQNEWLAGGLDDDDNDEKAEKEIGTLLQDQFKTIVDAFKDLVETELADRKKKKSRIPSVVCSSSKTLATCPSCQPKSAAERRRESETRLLNSHPSSILIALSQLGWLSNQYDRNKFEAEVFRCEERFDSFIRQQYRIGRAQEAEEDEISH